MNDQEIKILARGWADDALAAWDVEAQAALTAYHGTDGRIGAYVDGVPYTIALVYAVPRGATP